MSIKRLGIFGTSGFAREVGDIAVELGFQPIYVARDDNEVKLWTFADDIVLEADVRELLGIEFAIGIGDNAVRRAIAQRFAGELRFPSLIHPSASFGRNQRQVVERCRGVVVCAGVRFTNNIRVGDFSVFNLNATIGHDVVAGEFVNVAPGVCVSGNVDLGDGCFIGTGAVVNQGSNSCKRNVGANTVIGSGSVVVTDCEPDSVYVGVPARKIK